jgi:hypothetical protein
VERHIGEKRRGAKNNCGSSPLVLKIDNAMLSSEYPSSIHPG